MDIGNLRNNTVFYDGYEGEPEIILSYKGQSDYCIHIWDGYFDDVFANPLQYNGKWIGFTRDIHQMEGLFSDDESAEFENPEEYLHDLLLYENAHFDYEESSDVYSLLTSFFQIATENNLTVVGTRL